MEKSPTGSAQAATAAWTSGQGIVIAQRQDVVVHSDGPGELGGLLGLVAGRSREHDGEALQATLDPAGRHGGDQRGVDPTRQERADRSIHDQLLADNGSQDRLDVVDHDVKASVCVASGNRHHRRRDHTRPSSTTTSSPG